jgi:biofilm PGA synthesis lipoprotein PgaB
LWIKQIPRKRTPIPSEFGLESLGNPAAIDDKGPVEDKLNRKAREKVIFKVQTYDWKNRRWLADHTIKQQLAYLEAGGGRHVAYYPDDVFNDKPSALSLAPTISGRDTAARIKISPQ